MSSSHFIVYERDASWQFSHRGSITAPFITREDAIAAAILAARDSKDGDAEVLVQDADMRTETVWRTERPGA